MDIEQITHETFDRVERLDRDVRQVLNAGTGATGSVDTSGLKTSINNNIESAKTNIKGADDVSLTDVKDHLDSVKTDILGGTENMASIASRISSAKTDIIDAVENIDLGVVNTKIENTKANIKGTDDVDLTNIKTQIESAKTDIVDAIGNCDAGQIDTKIENVQSQIENTISLATDIKTKVNDLSGSIQTIGSNVTTINSNTATTASSIETIKQDIAVLKKKMSVLVFEDTSYVGKSFSDYPAGTIIKTYDVDERNLNMTHTSGLTLPKIYFCSEAGCAGQIKIRIEFKILNNPCNALITTMFNGTQIDQEEFVVESANTTCVFEKTFSQNFNETEKGNNVFVKFLLNNNVSEKSIVVSKQKIEIFAPNADIINKLCNFDVVCLADGKYHIADCTSGTAKICEVDATSMNNATELEFTDTGIETSDYRFASNYKEYYGSYVFDKLGYVYMAKNNKYCYNLDNANLKTVDADKYYVEWMDMVSNYPVFIRSNYSLGNIQFQYYKSSGDDGFNGSMVYSQFFVKTCGSRFPHGVNTLVTGMKTPFVTIDSNGHVDLYSSLNDQSSIDLGYGTDATIYFKDYNSNLDCKFVIYIKRYDKIIKKTIEYKYFNFNLIETIEMGAYEKFFAMPNNDYFVIKNNELKYYKNLIE